MPTFVSMGPGAMALNLNPYRPHSAASDLHTHKLSEEVSSHHPVTFSDAEEEYNRSKNRFPDKLPSECMLLIASYFVCAT